MSTNFERPQGYATLGKTERMRRALSGAKGLVGMSVDFFICGVQKGGTSALDAWLRAHPGIEMARPTKELHFFDDESLDWARPDYRPLHAAFTSTDPTRPRGEATPIYVYWPRSLERIHAYNPKAKMLVLLRHPIWRAFSHWRMETARGVESLPFAEAIGPVGRERVRRSPEGVSRAFSYVERGMYALQIERLLGLFPRSQVLFLRTDGLWLEPARALGKVCSFLSVPPIEWPERRYVGPVATNRTLAPTPRDIEYLAALFADDIPRTQALTGLDLQDWLDPAGLGDEPMRP
jgi:hypothetical protein